MPLRDFGDIHLNKNPDNVLNEQGCEVRLESKPKYLILVDSARRTFWQGKDLLMAHQHNETLFNTHLIFVLLTNKDNALILKPFLRKSLIFQNTTKRKQPKR